MGLAKDISSLFVKASGDSVFLIYSLIVWASANITGLGILRKEGYEVSAGTFMKVSVPFTLSAVITGYILIWFIWR